MNDTLRPPGRSHPPLRAGSGSPAFEFAARELQARTELSQAEARGTLRIIIKDAGFSPETIGHRDLSSVVHRLLSGALQRRRKVTVTDNLTVSTRLAHDIADLASGGHERDPVYDLFLRLGGKIGER